MALYLGLGSNLGARRRQLQQAVEQLGTQLTITALSSLFETARWGETNQPPFLNLCLAAETPLAPTEVLALVQTIEQQIGRRPTYRWGPRLIDIDLLLFDDHILTTSTLQLPHPFFTERAFVLTPLAEIAPQLRHPVTGKRVVEMLAAVDVTGVRRLTQPLLGPHTAEVGQ